MARFTALVVSAACFFTLAVTPQSANAAPAKSTTYSSTARTGEYCC